MSIENWRPQRQPHDYPSMSGEMDSVTSNDTFIENGDTKNKSAIYGQDEDEDEGVLSGSLSYDIHIEDRDAQNSS